MTADIYERFRESTVPEPVVAGEDLPASLHHDERVLYRRLLSEPRGRLEQEFLPAELAQSEILRWASVEHK
jgi:hypothetical protein